MEITEAVGMGAMENPDIGLDRQEYMIEWNENRAVVHLCAYKWPFRKGTSIWPRGFEFKPQGVTGDGKCGGKCDEGMVDPATGII